MSCPQGLPSMMCYRHSHTQHVLLLPSPCRNSVLDVTDGGANLSYSAQCHSSKFASLVATCDGDIRRGCITCTHLLLQQPML